MLDGNGCVVTKGGFIMGRRVHILMSVIGVMVIIMGIWVHISNAKYLKRASTTKAVITDIEADSDDDYKVYITYNVNNVNYTGVLGEYNSRMYAGQEITIYYNPENPSDCRGKSTNFAGLLCIGFGIVWLIFNNISRKT